MFDKFETKATLNKKLFDLLKKAEEEADPKGTSLWRDTVKEAMEVANTLDYDFIFDLLWEIANLHGSGPALRLNTCALLRVVRHEVKNLKPVNPV